MTLKAELPITLLLLLLQIACKAVNNTAGPDGLVPTLLVFGVYPRISDNNSPIATVSARARAVQKAIKELRKRHTARSVADARAIRNSLNIYYLKELSMNDKVIIYCEHGG